MSWSYRSYLPFIEVKLFGPKSGGFRVKLLQMVYKLLETTLSVLMSL
ncbi:hypothetical protein OK016_01910 [Vibrio chagasii]|nr:hypothetical protein [Vibrio chagasii]